MKRVFFSVVLLMATSMTFAQTKAVKDAKSAANSGDFAKAETLINGALTDAETKDQAETWNVAGFIQQKKSAKENEKAYLRQPYDTATIYNSALKMCEYFFKCDELAQQPDAKGKVKNKYRKNNAASILAERGNLINGGIYYFNAENNAEALKFFGAYVETASAPIMESYNLVKADTLLSQIAYYASLAAIKAEAYSDVLKYTKYAEDDVEYGRYAMEFASTAWKALDKTDEWLTSLKAGVQKYPDHSFFFGNLIDYYSNNDKFDEAMAFADEMLAKDPNNTFNLYVKAYLYHNMKEYDKAIEAYKNTLAVDPNYGEAYSNLGLIYCVQAQDYSQKASSDMNDPQYDKDQEYMRGLYEKAKDAYEKAREVKPDSKELWLMGLNRVYYILGMENELKEIEAMM